MSLYLMLSTSSKRDIHIADCTKGLSYWASVTAPACTCKQSSGYFVVVVFFVLVHHIF